MSGKSELRLFDVDMPQVVVSSGIFTDVNPSTSLSENSNTVDFIINASETEYLDLNDTLLYLRLKVTASDGKNIAKESLSTPSNFFMNALFSDVSLMLNDTVVEGGNHLYPYKSTIESIFNFNKEVKNLQFYPMGYHDNEDTRKTWISESRVCELAGALRLDFLNQPKYLLPGVSVKITMQRSKSKFAVIHGKGDPVIKMLAAKLYVRRVRVNPSVSIGHELGLAKKNATYSYNRGQVVSYAIPTGSLSHYKDNLFSRLILPKFVIVGFVSSAAFNGSQLEQDPFKFDHFNVSGVGLFRDGQSMPYRDLYEPDFENKLYTREYVKSILHQTQHLNTNLSNGIDLKKFAGGGYTFFTFNLTPDFDYTQCQMPYDGNLRLEVKFAKPLPESINVIVYAMFDSQLQITRERKIICDNVH